MAWSRLLLRFALDGLRAQRGRSLLTMLGMGIGTASVVLVVSIGLVGRDYVVGLIEGVGSNLVFAYGNGVGPNPTELSFEDLTLVEQRVRGVGALAPVLDDVATLVPLEKVYAAMGACPAQQKLVVFDVCRFDPGRGQERPGGGPMSEALEKALHAPPPGVQVLTTCSAGESAYEVDYAIAVDRSIIGSAFLSNVRFEGMSREDVLKILGDHYTRREDYFSEEMLVYRFDSGWGGWAYTLFFESRVERTSL